MVLYSNLQKSISGTKIEITRSYFKDHKYNSELVEGYENQDMSLNRNAFTIGHSVLTDWTPNFFILCLSTEFMVTFYCQRIQEMKLELASTFSQTRNPEQKEIKLMEACLRSRGINLTMSNVNQENCPSQYK